MVNDMGITSLLIIIVSFSVLSIACARQDEDLTSKSIEEIARMIHNEIGTAEAESADRCDVIPIGVKPAGGPWGFLVFSTEQSDRARLEQLVERYNELDAERNTAEGGFSTADIATKPSVTLKNGICTGEGTYAWNSGDLLDFNNMNGE
jgi:hypothetical protein